MCIKVIISNCKKPLTVENIIHTFIIHPSIIIPSHLIAKQSMNEVNVEGARCKQGCCHAFRWTAGYSEFLIFHRPTAAPRSAILLCGSTGKLVA